VAHSYNPSYLEGRDQEDCGSKSAQANSLPLRPYLRKNHPKNRAGGMAQGAGPEFNPCAAKKRKKSIHWITCGPGCQSIVGRALNWV
jgi:hypothetical protein